MLLKVEPLPSCSSDIFLFLPLEVIENTMIAKAPQMSNADSAV